MNMGEGSMKHKSSGAGNMKEGGPNHSWSMAGTRPGSVKALMLPLMAVALCLFLMVPQAFSAGASWQVGRGMVQKAGTPVLKLSLRNDGAPTKEGVRILGRWGQGAPGKRGFTAGELGGLSQLGSFSGEVELKKTAIIEVPLSALGTPPPGKTVLEIAVVTGGEITDGQAIAY